MSESVHDSGYRVFDEQLPFSRRAFIGGGLLVGFMSATGLLLTTNQPNHTRAVKSDLKYAGPRETSAGLESGKAFTVKFEKGIDDSWKTVNVWPGIEVLASDTKLFSMADLDPNSQVNWPEDKVESHLVVQRPFFVRATAELNGQSPPSETNPQVMAFWMPQSEQMLFYDRSANLEGVIPTTNWQGPTFSYDGIQTVGENVVLKPAATANGLTWRYLEAERIYNEPVDGLSEDQVLEVKVCARSLWADPGLVAQAQYEFSTAQGNDVIQLPSGIAR